MEGGTAMKLIDPDELERVLRPILKDESCPLHIAAEIDMNLDLMPKVDAVPVVRCKDCLHNRACEIQYHAQAGDLFFCGAAERKDGGNG